MYIPLLKRVCLAACTKYGVHAIYPVWLPVCAQGLAGQVRYNPFVQRRFLISRLAGPTAGDFKTNAPTNFEKYKIQVNLIACTYQKSQQKNIPHLTREFLGTPAIIHHKM